jgi:CrcB protein
MKALLLVAVGGAVGSAARFQISSWLLHQTVSWRFPIGTFSVNLLGCLVAGTLGGLIAKQSAFAPDVRLLLLTGVLGGFTTFSAFGLETFVLLKRGEIAVAAAYVMISVLAGLAGVWLGYSLVPGRGV